MSVLLKASVLTTGLVLIGLVPPPPHTQAPGFERFWAASNPTEATRAVQAVVDAGVTFDAALSELRRGRPYSDDVPTSIVHQTRADRFPYTLDVPRDYSPDRRYRVRVQLHGGIGRVRPETADSGVGRLAGVDQIYVLPAGWNDARWWTTAQVENLRAILDSVKRTYNVDENLVALSGISDGGTGAYYVAMRDPTPYSAVLPLIGFVLVLENSSVGAEGDLFPGNLRNRPFFVVNGGQDRLYPAATVGPVVEEFARRGVETVYRPQPDAGHTTRWWPQLRDEFEQFIADHPRDPLPDRLTWETSDADRSGRLHWLVIDELGSTTTDVDADDLDDLNRHVGPSARPGLLFPRSASSGRVDLERTGNTVEVTSRGVRAFTLLLSPGEFDFAQPVTVTVNGDTVFERIVEPDLETLMRWAARDNDRTMLFGAELTIRLR